MSEGMKRRDFLKVLGVSGAGVATVGCTTREVDKLIPYVVPPEEVVPGVATWYTSTCRECPAGCGIHVETHERRVTKVEGNPDHPASLGATEGCMRFETTVAELLIDTLRWSAADKPGAKQLLARINRAER